MLLENNQFIKIQSILKRMYKIVSEETFGEGNWFPYPQKFSGETRGETTRGKTRKGNDKIVYNIN